MGTTEDILPAAHHDITEQQVKEITERRKQDQQAWQHDDERNEGEAEPETSLAS